MSQLPEHGHESVMVEQTLHALAIGERAREKRLVLLDCTAGRGGHAVQMLRELAGAGEGGKGGVLIALDVDPANLKFTRKRLEAAQQELPGGSAVEIRTFHANFAEVADVLAELELDGIDGLLADFGVSTNQLLEERHGLSFNADVALDMRLDPRIVKTAADLLGQWDEKMIADVLHDYAQERFAWRIARKIVLTRAREPIVTTGQLARLVRSVVPAGRPGGGGRGQIDPATRTFQALRMAVNEEAEHLEELLLAVPELMRAQGRAVFISFHSGEDRLVKQAVKRWETEGLCEALSKKPVEPSEEEVYRNPRSRSAKLRSVVFKADRGGMKNAV